jgi:hypothetical protein
MFNDNMPMIQNFVFFHGSKAEEWGATPVHMVVQPAVSAAPEVTIAKHRNNKDSKTRAA